MSNKFRRSGLLAVGSLVLSTAMGLTPVHAQLIAPNLANGAQYRIAFVTSGGISATNTDIGAYDSFVNGLANGAGSVLASLGSNWQAIVSTTGADAYSHIGGAFAIPVYSIDGHRIASNAADLWDGNLAHPIVMNETGSGNSININSGTLTDGSRSSNPLGGDIGGAITGGIAGNTNVNWILGSFEGSASTRPIYGISQTLTVGFIAAVPEPEIYALLLAGLTMLGVAVKRRKRYQT